MHFSSAALASADGGPADQSRTWSPPSEAPSEPAQGRLGLGRGEGLREAKRVCTGFLDGFARGGGAASGN